MQNSRLRRPILAAGVALVLILAAVLAIGFKFGKQKLCGREVWVDLESARVRRVRYFCLARTSEQITTNTVAKVALTIFPKVDEHWVLAEREWLFSRTFDEFPETRLLDAIDAMNSLLDDSEIDDQERRNIVEQFILKLKAANPEDVQDFAHKLQSKYFK